MKYYYFHGYGSSPSACKAEAMREILGAENVSAPDFNVSVEEVSDLFDNLIDEISASREEVCIVGSSLGGLYALYVATKANCKSILLNPALVPMVIVPKVTDDVPVSAVVIAQKLSLYTYEHYNKETDILILYLVGLSDHKRVGLFPMRHLRKKRRKLLKS